MRGEAGFSYVPEARCSDRSDVLLCRIRSGTFATSHTPVAFTSEM